MAKQLINVGDFAGSGNGDPNRTCWIKTNSNIDELYLNNLEKRVIVNQLNVNSTLGGVIDSTKAYFIDGVVNCDGVFCEVPTGGVSIFGYDFETSQLTNSDNSHTLFTSPVSGSGNIIFENIGLTASGTSSKLFDLKSATGNEAIEFTRVNFNNCTDLGVLDNYRQGFESGTGRFGGNPSLELKGFWSGGYAVDDSIAVALSDGSYSLFSAGVGFTMASRFRSNQLINLPASASFIDFSPANFLNPSTVDLRYMRITRGGVSDAGDSNITPNISSSDLVCSWVGNKGLRNTFVGGGLKITTEVVTTIVTSGVFVDLAGTYTSSDLQHFDSPANGQLRHIGDGPIEYKVFIDLIISGISNNEIDVKVTVWDNSASIFVDYKTTRRVVNNLQGGRDVAFFNFSDNIVLDKNDYVKLMVANVGATDNVTLELSSEIIIEER